MFLLTKHRFTVTYHVEYDTIAPGQVNTQTIGCINLGDKEEKAFTVKIKSDQLVDELRDAIKNKNVNGYKGIDARDLTLYRHNVDTYNPKTFECKEADKLPPLKKMGACFGDSNPPLEGAINIVVLLPQSKSIDP